MKTFATSIAAGLGRDYRDSVDGTSPVRRPTLMGAEVGDLTIRDGETERPAPTPISRVKIKGPDGKPMDAWISRPQGRPKGVLVFVHGSTTPDGIDARGYRDPKTGKPVGATWEDLRAYFSKLGYGSMIYKYDTMKANLTADVRTFDAVLRGAGKLFGGAEAIPVCHSAGATVCQTAAARLLPAASRMSVKPRRFFMWGGGFDDSGLASFVHENHRKMAAELKGDLADPTFDPRSKQQYADPNTRKPWTRDQMQQHLKGMESDLERAPSYFDAVRKAIARRGPMPKGRLFSMSPALWKEAMQALDGAATGMRKRGVRSFIMFGGDDPGFQNPPVDTMRRQFGDSARVEVPPGVDHGLARTVGGPIDMDVLKLIAVWLRETQR